MTYENWVYNCDLEMIHKTKISHNIHSRFVSMGIGIFTEKRFKSAQAAIKPRPVEYCSDVCPSESFPHLHI